MDKDNERYCLPNPDADKNNRNWLQQIRLGGKTFDGVAEIRFKGLSVGLYYEEEKLVGILGDKDLAEAIKPYFEQPIKTMTGGMYKDEEGNTVYWDGIKELKPGDEGYIEVVLLEKIRNELGMEITW
jgi:hypothetical protein